MLKFFTKQGHIAYRCTAADSVTLGGNGICDDCGKASSNGFLVPVMNHYMCPKCFEEWRGRARFYLQDVPVEKNVADYYESRISWRE